MATKKPVVVDPPDMNDDDDFNEEAFMSKGLTKAAPKDEPEPDKPKKKKPVDTMVRFQQDRLDKIQEAADELGISRNAWINMACKRALENGL